MFLEITTGSNGAKIYPLRNRLLIGSAEPCDIILPVKGISRKHLLFLKDNEEYFVVDQGTTNGTYVDEKRIQPGLRVQIKPHIPVRLSGDVLVCITDDHNGQIEAFTEVKSYQGTSDATKVISLREFRDANETIAKNKSQFKARAAKKAPQSKYSVSDILNTIIFVLIGTIIYFAVRK